MLFPVRLLRHPLRHGGIHQAGGDTVDTDAVAGPFHGEDVDHVADAAFGSAVGDGEDALGGLWLGEVFEAEEGVGGKSDGGREKFNLFGSVGGHGGGEDDGTAGVLLDELAGGDAGAVEGAKELFFKSQY